MIIDLFLSVAAMRSIVVVGCLCLLTRVSAPPPRRMEEEKKEAKVEEDKDELNDFNLEYNRYLKEVVDLLESDSDFKKKLEQAPETDIRSGKIAEELEYVDHKVRTKLDEVKRQEIERYEFARIKFKNEDSKTRFDFQIETPGPERIRIDQRHRRGARQSLVGTFGSRKSAHVRNEGFAKVDSQSVVGSERSRQEKKAGIQRIRDAKRVRKAGKVETSGGSREGSFRKANARKRNETQTARAGKVDRRNLPEFFDVDFPNRKAN